MTTTDTTERIDPDDPDATGVSPDRDPSPGESGEQSEPTDQESAAVRAELSGVTRTYGGTPVLQDVSVTVLPGVTAVVGPNGSGKSTLLGILAGVVSPVEGSVARTDQSAADDQAERGVGYLPQRVPFRESFTARETLAFYARLVDADPDAALESVGLLDAADRRVEALSGGMRRLLGIAQATIGDPPLVVLDEPTSGLDPSTRERAFRSAAENAGDGTAVVVSSHDLDLVDTHADRLVVMDRGTVAASGPIETLYDAYDVESVAELYRAAVGERSERPGESTEHGAVHVTGVSE